MFNCYLLPPPPKWSKFEISQIPGNLGIYPNAWESVKFPKFPGIWEILGIPQMPWNLGNFPNTWNQVWRYFWANVK